MKLPRKPTKIERMWLTIKMIHRWNWVGGAMICVEPTAETIHLWKKMKKRAEKRYRKEHLKTIKEKRVGLIKAIITILKS